MSLPRADRTTLRPLVLAALAVCLVTAVVAMIACGDAEGGDPRPSGSGDSPFVRLGAGERSVIWAVGDGGDGSDDAKAVAARIARGPVDRLLYLGDVYDSGSAADFRRNYETTYGRLARVTTPVVGNHDARNRATGYDPYWRRVHGKRPPDWYSFRAAGWRLLVLDSEVAHDVGSAQYKWLRRQVRGGGTCRLAFWHRARYSAGENHGDQEDMAPLWSALRGRAAIVVSAHEHAMQRFKPIDGITEFVSGAGGKSLYRLNDDDRLAFGDDRSRGALRLRLRRGAAHYAFITADGRRLDSGTVRCRPSR